MVLLLATPYVYPLVILGTPKETAHHIERWYKLSYLFCLFLHDLTVKLTLQMVYKTNTSPMTDWIDDGFDSVCF